MIGERVLRLALTFLIGVLVSRHLGPEGFGWLNGALATAALCTSLVDLGLDSVLRRELINRPDQRSQIMGSALALRAIVLGPVAILLAYLFWRAPDGLFMALGPCLILLLGPIFLSLDSWFRSQTKAKYTAWAQTATLTLSVFGRLILVWRQAPQAAFVWMQAIELLFLGFLLVSFYRKTGESMSAWRAHYAEIRLLWRDSWPFALVGFSSLFYSRIDIVLLQIIENGAAAGHYAAGQRFSELVTVLPMVLISSFFPQLNHLHSRDSISYARKLQWLASLCAALAVAAACALTLGAPWGIPMVLGEDYKDTIPLVMIGAWAGVFATLGAVRAQWVLLENLQIYALAYVGISALLNLTLNLWLIPAHGAVGAAVASVVTQGFAVLLIPTLFRPLRPGLRFLFRALCLRGLFTRLHRHE